MEISVEGIMGSVDREGSVTDDERTNGGKLKCHVFAVVDYSGGRFELFAINLPFFRCCAPCGFM